MVHIFDHEGVLLGVNYQRGTDGVPELSGIRALDADYKPTGPDLTPMLANMMVWTIPGKMIQPLMNTIIEELPA